VVTSHRREQAQLEHRRQRLRAARAVLAPHGLGVAADGRVDEAHGHEEVQHGEDVARGVPAALLVHAQHARRQHRRRQVAAGLDEGGDLQHQRVAHELLAVQLLELLPHGARSASSSP
jgi:hypothetical protein